MSSENKKKPIAIGPYSLAMWAGDLLFCAGQIPIVPETGLIVEGGIKEQAVQALENVKSILESEGLSLADVVKATVFFKDLQDFQAVNEIYATYFSPPYPARSAVEVARLPRDVLVEVEVIARKP